MYVYKQTERKLWTVGFYTPEGKWVAESDHDTTEKAADRVSKLNGSKEDTGENVDDEIAHYISLLKNSDLTKLNKRQLIKDFILTLKDLN